MTNKSIVILDTSCIVAYLLSSKEDHMTQIFTQARSNKIDLYTSIQSLTELRLTIKKKSIKRAKQYNERSIGQFIAWYINNSIKIEDTPIDLKIRLRDKNDDMFISLVVASKADYLISVDKDLLILKSIGKAKIMTPQEFIKSISRA